MRQSLRLLTISVCAAWLLCACGGMASVTIATPENAGADCPQVALPDAASLPDIAKLPDPFQKLDGTRISSKTQWRCRRAEIVQQAEAYIYGSKPGKPDSVTGTVTDTLITINVTHAGKSASFTVGVDLPAGAGGAKPHPAIVGFVGRNFNFPLPADLVKAENVATLHFDPYVVGAESGKRDHKTGVFYTLYGAQSRTGLLAAWSWGVSRVLDVIAQSGGHLLKVDAVGVTGCSRFGKGAFTVGMLDERIALTLPIEPGSGGVAIWRGVGQEGGQSANSAYGETYWLGDAFGAFTQRVAALPVDSHAMVALVAPRGLFVMDNPHIAHLAPKSAHIAALGGAEVYRALGAGDNISYISAVADGTHCKHRPEWTLALQQNIRKHLNTTGQDAGVIKAADRAQGDLAAWRDWTTPTLD
jgi:hypothetical protein